MSDLSYIFFLNWDSPHARMNSHEEAWKFISKEPKVKEFLLILDLNSFRS